MTVSKRNLLKLLGLGAVASVNTEALATIDNNDLSLPAPNIAMRGREMQENMANALEALAKAIRDSTVVVRSFETTSRVDGESFMNHDLKLNIEITKDHVV